MDEIERGLIVRDIGARGPLRRYATQEVIDALDCAHGIYGAASLLGCTPRCVRQYIKRDPAIAEAWEATQGRTTDLAVLGLHEYVVKRERWAIMFQLRTQGKHLGYTMKDEVSTDLHITVEEREDWRGGGAEGSHSRRTEIAQRGSGGLLASSAAQGFGRGASLEEDDFGDEGELGLGAEGAGDFVGESDV